MNILKKQVSFFKNTKQIQVLGNYPIEKALQYIKEGKFKAQI